MFLAMKKMKRSLFVFSFRVLVCTLVYLHDCIEFIDSKHRNSKPHSFSQILILLHSLRELGIATEVSTAQQYFNPSICLLFILFIELFSFFVSMKRERFHSYCRYVLVVLQEFVSILMPTVKAILNGNQKTHIHHRQLDRENHPLK